MIAARVLEFPPEETAFVLRAGLLDSLRAQGQSPAEIIRRIEALWWSRNVDGYIFKPRPRASRVAKAYIRAIYPFVNHYLPDPDVDSDGLGGIVIQWSQNGRTVTLGCRPSLDQKDFIYYQQGRHGIMEASPLNLKERLTWLIS
jgi:hypothetical protein